MRVWQAVIECKHCKFIMVVHDCRDYILHACLKHCALISSDPNIVMRNNFNIIQDWVNYESE